MSYVLELKDRPGFLHAKVSGINSTTAVIEYTHDIHKACVERRCRAGLEACRSVEGADSTSLVLHLRATTIP